PPPVTIAELRLVAVMFVASTSTTFERRQRMRGYGQAPRDGVPERSGWYSRKERSMPAAETPEELAKQAKFVFHGKIRKLKASNMRVAPVSDQTAIVTVVDIVHAPPALEHYVGQDITVEMSEPGHHAGDELLFFANGWLFGEGVAVESIGEIAEQPTEQARKLAVLESATPTERLGQRELEEQVDSADLVVEGRVSSVRLPEKPAG